MLNKTCLPIAILLIYCVGSIHAQLDFNSFALDSFKLPSINRKTLDFEGSLLGNYTSYKTESDSNRNNYSQFAPSFSLDYFRFVNRPDMQASMRVFFNQDFSTFHDNETIFGQEITETSFSPSASIYGIWRKYNGNSFVLKGGSLYSDYDYDHNTENFLNGTDETKTRGLRNSFFLNIGFGKGRIETVTDVAIAMFILQDAVNLGIDVSSITQASIYEFASLMAEVRNRRIFDDRRMRIDELRSLYSFMQSKGWVVPDDAGFFTVLTDNWLYTSRDSRYSGKRWTYLFSPNFQYNSNYHREDVFPADKSHSTDVGAQINIEYRRDKPINLHRDNFRSHTFFTGLTNRNSASNSIEGTNSFMTAGLQNEIGKNWYPNNRTVVNGSLFGNYTYYRFLKEPVGVGKDDQHLIRAGINSQWSYFLSYKARLVADASLDYGYSSGGAFPSLIPGPVIISGGNANGFDFNFNLSLLVSIF